MKWIDLSEYDLRVVPVSLPTGRIVLLAIGDLQNNSVALSGLGFKKVTDGSMFSLRFTGPSGKLEGLSIASVREYFPDAFVAEMELGLSSSPVPGTNPPKQDGNRKTLNANALAPNLVGIDPIAKNLQGESVFEVEGKRVVMDSSKREVWGPEKPDLRFLQGGDDAAGRGIESAFLSAIAGRLLNGEQISSEFLHEGLGAIKRDYPLPDAVLEAAVESVLLFASSNLDLLQHADAFAENIAALVEDSEQRVNKAVSLLTALRQKPDFGKSMKVAFAGLREPLVIGPLSREVELFILGAKTGPKLQVASGQELTIYSQAELKAIEPEIIVTNFKGKTIEPTFQHGILFTSSGEKAFFDLSYIVPAGVKSIISLESEGGFSEELRRTVGERSGCSVEVLGHGIAREAYRPPVSKPNSVEPTQEPEVELNADVPGQQKSVAAERAAPPLMPEAGHLVEGEVNAPAFSDLDTTESTYQSEYLPASSVAPGSSMVPKHLAKAFGVALGKLQERVGDVDQFVANRLGLTVKDLPSRFSAEQVDAIALGLSNQDEGSGLILGDGTGEGKGRVLAAMALAAIRSGRRAIFLTEGAVLFKDFWRDVVDIGGQDVIKPFIVNDGVEIQGLPAAAGSEAANTELAASGAWPSDKNVILVTYSQLNRLRKQYSENGDHKTCRVRWLSALSEGSNLILDEAHNASGDSNTNLNVSRMSQAANNVIHSSATYVRHSKNFGIYESAFPSNLASYDIERAVDKLGAPMQEIVAAMLAEDGRFIRRENSLKDVSFELRLDERHVERNREWSDALAQFLSAYSMLTSEIKKDVSEMNAEFQADLKKSGVKIEGRKQGLSSMNFGSRLYQITRQFMLACTVDQAVEAAIAEMAKGQKPILVVDQTAEAQLLELMQTTSEEERRPPFFADILRTLIDRTVMVTDQRKDSESPEKVHVGALVDQDRARTLQDMANKLHELADDFPAIPFSPVDDIKYRLLIEGKRIGEITGRKFRVRSGQNGDAEFVPREDTDRLKTIAQFQDGGLDGVVISRAGASGISLHASARAKDQRKRTVIEVQVPDLVDKRIQAIGRAARRDQVVVPDFKTLSPNLPAYNRLAAMQNHKLRQMSASTTSNRDSYALIDTVDILNPVGDEIVLRYLESNPALAYRLGFDSSELDAARLADGHITLAAKVTGRLMMLPVAEQETVYEDLAGEYAIHMKELEAQGLNPFKTREMPLKAQVVERVMFEGVARAKYDSAFDRPVFLSKIAYEETAPALSSTDVLEEIEQAKKKLVGYKRTEGRGLSAIGDLIKAKKAKILEDSLVISGYPSVQDALDDTASMNLTVRLNDRCKWAQKTFQKLSPGQAVVFSNAGQPCNAVVGEISLPLPGSEHNLGQYRINLLVPGEKPIETTVNQLHDDEDFAILPAAFSTGSPMAAEFDRHTMAVGNTERWILEGNLFRAAIIAAEMKVGTPAIVEMEDGTNQRVVMLSRRATKDMMLNMGVMLASPGDVAAFVSLYNDDISSDHADSPKESIAIQHGRDSDSVWLRIPSNKKYSMGLAKDPAIQAIGDGFRRAGPSQRKKVPKKDLEKLCGILFAKYNVRFITPPGYREKLIADAEHNHQESEEHELDILPAAAAGQR